MRSIARASQRSLQFFNACCVHGQCVIRHETQDEPASTSMDRHLMHNDRRRAD